MGGHDLRTANPFSILSEEGETHEEGQSPQRASAGREQQQQMFGNLPTGSGSATTGKRNNHTRSQDAGDSISPGSGGRTELGLGISMLGSSSNATSFAQPMNPETLAFERLNLGNNESHSPVKPVPRYTAPFQRGIRGNNDIAGPDYRPNRYDTGAARGANYGDARFGNKFQRSSRTWVSPDAQAQQEWMIIRNSMRRQFKNAEVAKWKLADYIAHREAVLASQATRLASKVKEKEEAVMRDTPVPQVTKEIMEKWGVFGNFDQQGNLGRVLGEQTIWCDDWLNGKDEVAPWPSIAELKWEGDDRAKTGVGRFFPLPREEGPPGLSWNQLPVVEQFPMDQVALIPTMEDVYLPVDPYIEEEKEYLWSKDLEAAIDAFLES